MFDFDHTAPVLERMAQDADANVAKDARGLLEGLRRHKNLNPDLPY